MTASNWADGPPMPPDNTPDYDVCVVVRCSDCGAAHVVKFISIEAHTDITERITA